MMVDDGWLSLHTNNFQGDKVGLRGAVQKRALHPTACCAVRPPGASELGHLSAEFVNSAAFNILTISNDI